MRCRSKRIRPLRLRCAAVPVRVRLQSRDASEEEATTTAAATGTAGLVGPLTNDTSEDIVSWVDGQVVTNWPAEIGKRDQRHRRLLERHRPRPR